MAKDSPENHPSAQEYVEFVNKYWVDKATNLSIVLTGHLFIEKKVDDLIRSVMPHPDNLLKYRFAQKIEILFASGNLPQRTYDAIKIISIIRNKYAHDLEYEIDRKLMIKLSSLRTKPLSGLGKLDTSELLIKNLSYTMGLIHGYARGRKEPAEPS